MTATNDPKGKPNNRWVIIWPSGIQYLWGKYHKRRNKMTWFNFNFWKRPTPASATIAIPAPQQRRVPTETIHYPAQHYIRVRYANGTEAVSNLAAGDEGKRQLSAALHELQRSYAFQSRELVYIDATTLVAWKDIQVAELLTDQRRSRTRELQELQIKTCY